MERSVNSVGTLLIVLALALAGPSRGGDREQLLARAEAYRIDPGQISAWSSADDLELFLYGSLSSEFLPERVLRAFLAAYPDLFPGGDLSAYGVIDAGGDLPIGFSRRTLAHLGGQPSVGINCAVCHVAEVQTPDSTPLRILGRPSHFDPYSFYGAVAVSMLRTVDPQHMGGFLEHYLAVADGSAESLELLRSTLERQSDSIAAALGKDPMASSGMAPAELHSIAPADLELTAEQLRAGRDLVPVVRALAELFHNVRTALHLPEQLPPPVKALPGPGRNDAFNVLAYSFFGVPPTLEAPAKFGMIWNLDHRRWVHWDGNSDSPAVRNLAASMGLGAPGRGRGELVDYSLVERQTELTEILRPPRYPWKVDTERAASGEAHYRTHCASCHEASGEGRLVELDEVGTDRNRAVVFDAEMAALFNRWGRELGVTGFQAPEEPWRATGKYWASDLTAVWARSPYLHNGSVRTLWELLSAPEQRPTSFRIGSRRFDQEEVGYADEGPFLFDATLAGNSNRGHAYGGELAAAAKRELVEYLKSR